MIQQAVTIGTLTDMLLIACQAVDRSSGQLSAISLTDCLQGADTDARRLSALSQRLAEEYGLQAHLRFDDQYFTVRFSRRC